MTRTLRKALEENDLESFIAEHEDDPCGDLDKVEAVIRHADKEAPKSDVVAKSDE